MKTALTRSGVAVLAFITVVFALATALVKLLVTAVGFATEALENAKENSKTKRLGAAQTLPGLTKTLYQPPVVVDMPTQAPARPNLKVVTRPSKLDQLYQALAGMGYKAPNVKAFVLGLSPEAQEKDIRDLITDGLRSLSKAA